jgi:hypothetical protein
MEFQQKGDTDQFYGFQSHLNGSILFYLMANYLAFTCLKLQYIA